MRISFLLGIFSLLWAGFCWSKDISLDGIAAIVNNTIITKSELDNQSVMAAQQLSTQGPIDKQALKKQVLEHLILKEIQLQTAKKTGLEVDEIALDNAIESIAKKNNMTISQMRQAINQEGMDFNTYRQNVRQQLIISKLQQREIVSDVQVSEQEINHYLQSPNGLGGMINEFRLSHILIALPESPTAQELEAANTKARAIIGKLNKGEDFVQVALAESSGEHAVKGGDLGWRKLPELPTLFVKVVPRLKVNEISEPIRSPSGLHIVKLVEKRSSQAAKKTVEKTLVRHILIRTNQSINDKQAKQQLENIRAHVKKGESFEKLAKTHSADLGSANNGGSLGWISKEMLVPEFSDVMENIAINEVSEPFKTSFGWHILQVQDRQTQLSDEHELRAKAREMIQQRKFEEKSQAWSRQLRDESYVKIFI